MMKRLDQRGAAAFEFCMVAVPLFTLIFVIFDFGRYAITMQSLKALADAGARKIMIDDCYFDAAIKNATPNCSGDPLSPAAKQAAAPFLYNGGLTPTLNAVTDSAITVTAAQPGFTMIMPIWGTALNAPSATAKIPF